MMIGQILGHLTVSSCEQSEAPNEVRREVEVSAEGPVKGSIEILGRLTSHLRAVPILYVKESNVRVACVDLP